MEKKTNLIQCAYSGCQKLYDASWHKEGKAIIRGRWHFCSLACSKEHQELMERQHREQL